MSSDTVLEYLYIQRTEKHSLARAGCVHAGLGHPVASCSSYDLVQVLQVSSDDDALECVMLSSARTSNELVEGVVGVLKSAQDEVDISDAGAADPVGVSHARDLQIPLRWVYDDDEHDRDPSVINLVTAASRRFYYGDTKYQQNRHSFSRPLSQKTPYSTCPSCYACKNELSERGGGGGETFWTREPSLNSNTV